MRRTGQHPLIQEIAHTFIRLYMRLYHRQETRLPPCFSEPPPCLVVTSHFSYLDVPALMVADPYRPYTAFVVKESATRVPIVRQVLRAEGAIPVARDGKDLSAIRDVLQVLLQGRSMCIAAHGVRSRTGRLDALDPVLVKLALRAAAKGVRVMPIVEIGTFEAMPPGSLFPRPHKISVKGGDPIDLSRWSGRRMDDSELMDAAALIQASIASLLPPERRPAPGTPPIDLARLEQKSRAK